MKNMENVECILKMLLLEELFHFLAFFEGGEPVQSRYFFNFCCAKFTYIMHAIKAK